MTDQWLALCTLDDLPDPGAMGFMAGTGQSPLPGFVVRRGGDVFGYVNVCPHAGRPLNWKPGAFLTRDGSMIMCSAHGALFEIATGLCVAGPCSGASLRHVEARIDGGVVLVRSP